MVTGNVVSSHKNLPWNHASSFFAHALAFVIQPKCGMCMRPNSPDLCNPIAHCWGARISGPQLSQFCDSNGSTVNSVYINKLWSLYFILVKNDTIFNVHYIPMGIVCIQIGYFWFLVILIYVSPGLDGGINQWISSTFISLFSIEYSSSIINGPSSTHALTSTLLEHLVFLLCCCGDLGRLESLFFHRVCWVSACKWTISSSTGLPMGDESWILPLEITWSITTILITHNLSAILCYRAMLFLAQQKNGSSNLHPAHSYILEAHLWNISNHHDQIHHLSVKFIAYPLDLMFRFSINVFLIYRHHHPTRLITALTSLFNHIMSLQTSPNSFLLRLNPFPLTLPPVSSAPTSSIPTLFFHCMVP